jgi:hypothetical protein
MECHPAYDPRIRRSQTAKEKKKKKEEEEEEEEERGVKDCAVRL